MSKIPHSFLTLAMGLLVFTPWIAGAAEPLPLAKDWTFDSIKLKNGFVLQGMILEETAAGIRFQNVRRTTGHATVCMTTLVRRVEIDRIDRISESERERLRTRLKELDPNGEGERKRMEALEMIRVDWNGKPKAGYRYDSDYFSLLSNAPEEVLRRSAVRLEQIYTAYAHFLQPRHSGGKPTTIVLCPSLDDYQEMLKHHGWKLQNPAFFDPASNRIFCGSNLLKLGDDLEKIRLQHLEQRAELDKRETLLRQLYGKKPMELARHLQPIQEYRKDIAKADRHNGTIFDNETRRLFTILYHEAFHAYVANFVYPGLAKETMSSNLPGELPRWLNEGLAQIFETAIVESGELRVGHADKDRCSRVKEACRQQGLLPLKDLLASGPKQFIVQHRDDRLASDRTYLTSWALTAYLTFERRLLGSVNLDEFVRSTNKKGDVEIAFTKLVGQPLAEFEKDFHAWIGRLPTNGTLLESMNGQEK